MNAKNWIFLYSLSRYLGEIIYVSVLPRFWSKVRFRPAVVVPRSVVTRYYPEARRRKRITHVSSLQTVLFLP